ncbi:MAG: universal stress protein [Reyranella sp.]|uniref:universal stress protein n=1 Tax=Reyranella sp. TaxID=1929291 RepID=UPI00273149E0|nr:universal stress protein [Reyranella sp.]MDP1965960.1 universal stress protein [Reyranella sp.]MDP2374334.1 universal stress protein [Reyranella sp.]
MIHVKLSHADTCNPAILATSGIAMLQNVKDVLIGRHSGSGPTDEPGATAYGMSLALKAGAHATIESVSASLRLHSTWSTDHAAGLVATESRSLQALAKAAAEAGIECIAHAPHRDFDEFLGSFVVQARLHDLTILDADPGALANGRRLIEGLLTQSGRPLIVVPPGCTEFADGNILVAWDGSATAARAVNDALPLLRTAATVHVASVTGEKVLPALAGQAGLISHLGCHGIWAVERHLALRNGDVAQTLREAARDQADMIIMGGFAHRRVRELVLGGVTQSLLGNSPVPLFMSH